MTAADLRPGTGPRVRREYRLRALTATVLAAGFAAAAVYGAYGVLTGHDSAVPFLVFGVAGAAAQLVLAVAFITARAAISGDRYDKPAVTRARRAVSALLVLLVAAVIIGFLAGAATLGRGLTALMTAGLVAAFAVTADGWRHLRHLG